MTSCTGTFGAATEGDTVRSVVRELRRKLVRANMRPLPDAIRGQGRHYGLILRPPRT
jgi:hypothetical protein